MFHRHRQLSGPFAGLVWNEIERDFSGKIDF